MMLQTMVLAGYVSGPTPHGSRNLEAAMSFEVWLKWVVVNRKDGC